MAKSDSEYIAHLEAKIKRLESEKNRHFSWRQFMAWVFLVTGLITLVPAGFLIWANRTITDPTHYMSITSPLIHQTSVQNAITKAANDAIFANVDIDAAVTNALPPNAQFLADPIANQVQGFATKTIGQIVASDDFAKLWDSVNLRAQQRFMQIARSGRQSPDVTISDFYQRISDRLADTKLAPLANRQLPQSVGSIVIFNSPLLVQIPHFVSTLSDLRWLFVAMAAGLLILALATSTNRRQMGLFIGTGWIIAALVTIIIVRLTGSSVLEQVSDPTYNTAAKTIWDAFMTPLLLQTLVLSLAGAVVIVMAWLAGPARQAVKFRHYSQKVLASWRHNLTPQLGHGGAHKYLHRHHNAFLWALLFLGVGLIIIAAPLTVLSFFGIVALLVALLLVMEFIAAPEST